MPTPPPSEGPGPAGTLPGTEHLGVIFLEYVNIERKVSGVWGPVASHVPATFEPVKNHTRVDLEPWTHKPIFCLWLYPRTPVADADRVVRSDGSRWYVRGVPVKAPRNTHVLALVEGSAEDGLFAARNPAEP